MNREYQSDHSRVSKTGLDMLDRSPAHYFHQFLNPDRLPVAEKEERIVGRAVDGLVFEPKNFHKNFVVSPPYNRRSNDGRDAYNEFKAANADKTTLSVPMYDLANTISQAVKNHPAAAFMLEAGVAEQIHHFTEPMTGAPCKVRTDFISENSGFILDLIISENAAADPFSRAAFKYRYHVKDAFYYDGVAMATGHAPKGLCFIVVEKEPPHAVALYYLDDRARNLGRVTYQQNLLTYMECLKTDEWPAFGDEVRMLSLPRYAF